MAQGLPSALSLVLLYTWRCLQEHICKETTRADDWIDNASHGRVLPPVDPGPPLRQSGVVATADNVANRRSKEPQTMPFEDGNQLGDILDWLANAIASLGFFLPIAVILLFNMFEIGRAHV